MATGRWNQVRVAVDANDFKSNDEFSAEQTNKENNIPSSPQQTDIPFKKPSLLKQGTLKLKGFVGNLVDQRTRTSYMTSILIFGMLLFMLIFVFWIGRSPEDWSITNEGNDYLSGFYFWTTTTSTVGYGDVLPVSPAAKVITGFYHLFITAMAMGIFASYTNGKLKDKINNLKHAYNSKLSNKSV